MNIPALYEGITPKNKHIMPLHFAGSLLMFEPQNDQERVLQWRCRRGLKELDVIIQPFLADGYRELDPAAQAAFTRLMACEDPDLLDWFLRQSTPADPELEQLVEHIRQRVAR